MSLIIRKPFLVRSEQKRHIQVTWLQWSLVVWMKRKSKSVHVNHTNPYTFNWHCQHQVSTLNDLLNCLPYFVLYFSVTLPLFPCTSYNIRHSPDLLPIFLMKGMTMLAVLGSTFWHITIANSHWFIDWNPTWFSCQQGKDFIKYIQFQIS